MKDHISKGILVPQESIFQSFKKNDTSCMNMIQMSLCHCVNLYPWPTSLSKGSYALQLLVAGLCWQDQHRWVGAAQLIAVLVDRMGSSRIKWLFH